MSKYQVPESAKIIRTQRHVALRNPSEHVFVPQVGYVKVPALTQMGRASRGNCNAHSNTEDGSWHCLKIPSGATYITFQWIAKHWVRIDPSSNRLGFTPEYLSSHGWIYMGKASGRHG